MDLIDRQAAIEIIQSMYPGMPRIPWMRKDWQKRYEPYIRTENAIRELPSAQPERKIGKWIETKQWGGRNYYCSNCRYEFTVDTAMMKPMWNYCPNCGADMRGKEGE